jgi:predicted outer membrane repeat protein
MPPNKLYPIIILLLISFCGQAQTIIPGGYVSGTWDAAGSPYIIQSPITIHGDSTLYITQNVVIEFYDTAFLQVFGYISAIGSPGSFISFTAFNTEWQGIKIMGDGPPGADSTRFAYCSFEYGTDTNDDFHGGVLSIHDREELNITECLFRYNYAEHRGGALYIVNSDILIKNAYFIENSTGSEEGFSKGGAIYVLDSEPIFKQLEFQDNESLVGGALFCDNTSLFLNQSYFLSNESNGGGGAMVCHNSGDIYIGNCLFEDNFANGSGGGIAFLEGISAQIEYCEFFFNWASSEIYLADGGAVFVTPYDNEMSMVNCHIHSNVAGDYGGGLYTGSPGRLVSCLFNDNEASNSSPYEGGGGAITLAQTSILLLNSTFSENYGGVGTTIYCEDAEVAMINSILWDDFGNSDTKIFLSTIDNPPSLFIDHSDIEGGIDYVSGTGGYMVNWATGNMNEDPLFEWPSVDFSLVWNSPCINAGRSDTLFLLIPPEDIAGNPRIMGGEIDMGCYEYQGPISIPEISIEQDFLVYPNPAGDYIYLKSETEIDFIGNLILTDFSGRILLNRKINISSGELIRQTLKGLPSGFYILNLLSNEHSYAKKLIIK